MNQEELNKVLELHKKWLNDEEDGVRANLYRADLEGAENYYSFTAYDTSKRIVHCVKHEDTWMIKAGCFWGTLEELEDKVKETHNSKVYLANIKILKGLI